MQETMPGARRRGRPRTAWMDNIKTWTGLSMEKSTRITEDMDKWRKYVHGVANPRIKDGSDQVMQRFHLEIIHEPKPLGVFKLGGVLTVQRVVHCTNVNVADHVEAGLLEVVDKVDEIARRPRVGHH